jgi:hypothetical protein
MKKSKAQAQAAHFKRRLRERYGIYINRFEYRELCKRANRLPSIEKQTNRVSLRMLKIHGIDVIVCYDRIHHTLVTALFPVDNRCKTDYDQYGGGNNV